MKIEVIYLHVLAKSSEGAPEPEYYRKYTERFLETYRRYSAGVHHTLRVVFCGREPTPEEMGKYIERLCISFTTATTFDTYTGTGWDIGAHQHAALSSDADMVYCLATPVHFTQDDWLTPIADAWQRHGDGLYGPMASCENAPHIRTSAFAFSPATMRQYPWLIDSRETCFHFESGFTSTGEPFEDGSKSFTNWMAAQGKPVLMVTRDRCYEQPHWRKADNIFRRGDQSNCLLWDRHNDIYAAADEPMKRTLEHLADGVSWKTL